MAKTFINKQIESLYNKAQSKGISRRAFLQMLAVGGVASIIGESLPSVDFMTTVQSLGKLKSVHYTHLPRWRGFNLLEKYRFPYNKPYNEWDLDFIAEWGFDFVRLPTDYRIWTTNPGVYEEQPLREIDQVINWARARRIHVNLCLHRAPGYCVHPPPEESLDLWADGPEGDTARQQFAAQWKMFAERYQGIPSKELSFNLVNEPGDISGEQYVRSMCPAIEAIKEADADRLIIADGLKCGEKPVPELVPLKVGQSTRGYWPFMLSHYHIPWIRGGDKWPVPTWPIQVVINQYLYGDAKPEFKKPLVLKVDFPESRQLSITVQQVSNNAELFIKANGEVVWQKVFRPGPGLDEWKEVVFNTQWQTYLGKYDKEYTISLPVGTQEIQIEVGKGDWLSFSAIRIKPFPDMPTNEFEIKPNNFQWGVRHQSFILDQKGNLSPASGQTNSISRETLWSDYVEPWKTFSTQYGTGIHVGEWGVYNQTPHDAALRWMKDCLENWRQAGVGWALWHLRGSFGVLDSERNDVAYDNYQGHKLDREMLELLRQG